MSQQTCSGWQMWWGTCPGQVVHPTYQIGSALFKAQECNGIHAWTDLEFSLEASSTSLLYMYMVDFFDDVHPLQEYYRMNRMRIIILNIILLLSN